LSFVDNLNPVLMHLGPLQIHWYGVMYALSFIIGYYLICHLAQKRGAPLDRDGVTELVLYLIGGVLFGGRLGYVLFLQLALLPPSSRRDRGRLGWRNVVPRRDDWSDYGRAAVLAENRH